MHNWFECKVSYEKMLENGMQKKVTEPYFGRRPVFYGSGSSHHRGDPPLHHG